MSLDKRVDDFLIGELYKNEDVFIITPNHDYYKSLFQKKQNKGLIQNWNSTGLIHKEIKALRVDDYMKLEKRLPLGIYDFPNLEYLEIPSHMVKQIEWKKFKSLKVLISIGANLIFKEEDKLLNLMHIYLNSGTLRFLQKNLPSLKSVGCKYTNTVMTELYKYKVMDNVMYSNANENIFEKLSQLEMLRKLDIVRGKIDSIAGIATIKGLESLQLALLPNLYQLEELIEIPTLEKLFINTCKNIASWEFLLELKSLKQLVLFANGNNNPNKEITEALRKKGITGIY